MSDDFKLNDETLSEALTLPSNREAEEAPDRRRIDQSGSLSGCRPVPERG